MGSLAGKVAIVTGASRGIGAAAARALAKAGTSVMLAARDGALANEVARSIIAAGGNAAAQACDVSDYAGCENLVAETLARFGRLDVLVNNAGIAGPTKRVEDVTPDELDATLRIDLAAMFHTVRRAVPALREAGGGSIVNLSSAAGRFGFPLRSPYAAAKWGVVGLTKTLAIELGADGIRVNAILPGLVDGPRIRAVLRAKAQAAGVSENEQTERAVATTSLRCFVSQQDIANMALYLCSPFGATISGQALAVDGDMQVLV